MAIIVEEALTNPGTYIWGAPTYTQVSIGFAETKKALGDLAIYNQSKMTITIPQKNSVIVYRSLDNPDNVRGFTANGIVIDECGVIKDGAWAEVLRPMLIDTNGWAWGIGTPKGHNWFWAEHNNAVHNDDTMSWQVPTLGVKIVDGKLQQHEHPLENPDIPFAEIEHLFNTLPEAIFRQEVLAEFIEDGGLVFRNISAVTTALEQLAPLPNHRYVFGVDWGKHNDFTVITVWDVTQPKPQLAFIDRFNQIDYDFQTERLTTLYEIFKPYRLLAEINSIGEPLLTKLKRQGLPIGPFLTTNASKVQAVEALSLAIERQEVELIPDPTMMAELQAFGIERLPSGSYRYSAPAGGHDDIVMSMIIGYHAATTTGEPASELAQIDMSLYTGSSRQRLWQR